MNQFVRGTLMSSLLEQAIVDAAALKEAAIKNAETAILNKYSDDIREAVENLLEEEIPEAPETPDIPLAAAPPSDAPDETITLNFDDLKEMAETLAAQDEELIGDEIAHEAAAPEDLGPPPAPANPEAEVPETTVQVALEEEIESDDLEKMLEELIVDIIPQKSGWEVTPDAIMDDYEHQAMAHRAATAAKEKAMALIDANERLTEQVSDLKQKNKTLIDSVRTLKENFDKINLSNARLVYTNKILTNGSLNGQQKNKIVNALSEARSIEEAKVIYETLENAVGSVTGKARPQSLRETLERPSATLPRRAARETVGAPVMDRMQILAGIKKNT